MTEHEYALDVKETYDEKLRKLEKWEIVSKLVPSNKLLLDVGCYNGSFSRYLRTHAHMHRIGYVGVNINSQAIDDAKGKKLDAVLASCDFLPFKNEAFDACSLLHVVERVYFPDNAIKEAYRILKSNGKLILVTRNFADFINRVYMLIGINVIPGFEQSEIIRFFTWKSLNNFLKRHGFEFERRETWFIPFPMRKITDKYPTWRKVMRFPARLLPNLSDSLMGRWIKTG